MILVRAYRMTYYVIGKVNDLLRHCEGEAGQTQILSEIVSHLTLEGLKRFGKNKLSRQRKEIREWKKSKFGFERLNANIDFFFGTDATRSLAHLFA